MQWCENIFETLMFADYFLKMTKNAVKFKEGYTFFYKMSNNKFVDLHLWWQISFSTMKKIFGMSFHGRGIIITMHEKVTF